MNLFASRVARGIRPGIFAVFALCGGCKKSEPSETAAPVIVDAGPPKPWCARQSPAPRMCEDFDTPSFDLGSVLHSDGDVALSPAAKSAPNALTFRAIMADAASGDRSGAWMMMNTLAPAELREAHVAFDVQLGDINGTAELASIGIGSALLSMSVDGRGARLVQSYMDADAGGPRRELAFPKPLPNGMWAHVTIDIAAGGKVTVAANGAPASADTIPFVGKPRDAFLIFGLRQSGAPTNAKATFDDVTLDVK